MSRYRLGVDVGGTFTDAFLLDARTGSLQFRKIPSKPADPEAGVLEAIAALTAAAGVHPGDISYFVHGTTLAINTLVQRTGTATGLLVTRGYRDLLELGRGRLKVIHNFYSDRVPPVVPRDLVGEVDERLYASGEVRTPVDVDEVEACARRLVERGARALAICFLHSYRNPAHEAAALERLQSALPDVYACASHSVWPQVREYERAMAAIINAYVGGPMARYYRRLTDGLDQMGFRAPISVTRSTGGIMTAGSAARTPVETLFSGPAAGVLGAIHLARQAGVQPIICLDMGGTTADVSVADGQPRYTFDTEAAGFPISLPAIDIASIGAGGGSIAWLDPAGVLRVGPRSAGANPGPAAYGKGGEEPTVTDAYVALGYVHPDRFLGGQMKLDAGRAGVALAGLADHTGEGVREVAEQILTVATTNMYAQLLPLLSRQGIDPADCTLFAYGGAGPTQAFFLAEELGVPRVLVPPVPGGVCALGCLVSDFRSDLVRTLYRRLSDVADGELEAEFTALEMSALEQLDREGVALLERYCLRQADMRYVGQSFEVNVPLGASITTAAATEAFHQCHRSVYGHADQGADVEVVNLRIQVVGVPPKPPETKMPARRVAAPLVERRPVWFRGGEQSARVWQRADLVPGDELPGPVIVEQYDSTVVIPPGWSAEVDATGCLRGRRV